MRQDMKKRMRNRVERQLSQRIVPRHSAPLLKDLEGSIETASRVTWEFFHHIPIQGALTSGAVGLYVASAFGVAELTAAGLTTYVMYRIFAYNETLLQAIENTIKFQKGDLPFKDKYVPDSHSSRIHT
jgi:hypothetical protein